jgi:hypothetical protein
MIFVHGSMIVNAFVQRTLIGWNIKVVVLYLKLQKFQIHFFPGFTQCLFFESLEWKLDRMEFLIQFQVNVEGMASLNFKNSFRCSSTQRIRSLQVGGRGKTLVGLVVCFLRKAQLTWSIC